MKIIGAFLAACLCAFAASPAWAQSSTRPMAIIVPACGTAPSSLYIAGTHQYEVMDVNGSLCTNVAVSVSASIGGFLSGNVYATLTATGSTSSSTALPAGATVRVQNVGTTAVSCVLASGAATGLASKIVVQSGATTYLVTTGFDHIACIDQAGSASNLVVLVGGSGLGTDSGGGSSGSGGGAATIADGADVTQGAQADAKSTATDTTPVSRMSVEKQISASAQAAAASAATTATNTTGASTAANQTTANASLAATATALGAPGDAVCSTATGTCSLEALIKYLNNAATGSVPAGTALIGKFGIDQTTPGTTNGVENTPGVLTLVTLDVATVTTGGTAVAALSAAHRNKGGWIANPIGATINLCINEIGTASGTTSAGNTTCILPGTTYGLAPSGNAVSVISSDSAHPFSGMGFN